MNSISDIWDEVLKILSKEITPTAINTWFADSTPVAVDNCSLIIHTTNDFKRNIIQSRFSEKIEKILSDIFSCDFELTVIAGDESIDLKKEEKSPIEGMEWYTFDRFIVGSSNKFAHSAAKAVAENPGDSKYNPLLIYGNSGLGKTHLLLAIGRAIHAKDPSKTMAYIKGDEFTNQLVNALQSHNMDDFRAKFRNVDLLLMDDIQFIAGKERTQEEFFHTFNNIYEAGHQIVITSDRPPMEMNLLEDRLRTRFEGGLMADIQPPDFETRMAIIKNKAAQFGLIISDEAVQYIAENITANVRQIEGVVKRLTAYKEILNDVITPDSVKRAIDDVIKNGTYIPKPEKIIQETARHYGIDPKDVRGQNRAKNTAMARHVSMYLMRSLTNLSLEDIGKEFEDRNHSTVLSSIKKIEDLIATDNNMSVTIRDITSDINSV